MDGFAADQAGWTRQPVAVKRIPRTATGQDIEETPDGCFRIFEGTAPDRIISTVDPQARHGHKTAAHGFDGYKAHVAVDPDSEVICAASVSPATTGDAQVAPTLLDDLVQDHNDDDDHHNDQDAAGGGGGGGGGGQVYGDSAYGTGANLAWLQAHRLTPMVKAQHPTAPGGRFGQDRFRIDLQAGTVTCPARVTTTIRPARHDFKNEFWTHLGTSFGPTRRRRGLRPRARVGPTQEGSRG